jgi:hypothetical protein
MIGHLMTARLTLEDEGFGHGHSRLMHCLVMED